MGFATFRQNNERRRNLAEKVERFNALLDRITYKHHYQPTFRFVRKSHDIFMLGLQFTLHSSVKEGHPYGPINLEQPYAGEQLIDMSDRAFVMELRELIRKMEVHEIDEWLKLDGQLISEPHPEKHTKRVHLDMYM